ncbi:bile acid:sodium symporter [Gordonia sp. L191]|uniref:arsenic resistance protein n=1 Tax=Gordonia sp. L191 TaxID=2982699 RepID=UPI0024BFEE7B|nr:bile acid:sodium symporter [Gordonia sp. L191]WHU49294.1 bile acid:sodium symporter [Gordonia sp. L191]
MEDRQVPLYLLALIVGGVIGVGAPGLAPVLTHLITPALAALLYVTFLQVPASGVIAALRDLRFLGAVLVANFVAVPLVVGAMYPFLPGNEAIRIGMLLVLLCPCIDYVIVFTGLAGGDRRRLLVSTPLLLLVQMVSLPLFLMTFLGADLAAVVDVEPFLVAFGTLIVVPLGLAWATQWWSSGYSRSGYPRGQRFSEAVSTTMVPLMMLVLAVVVASQIPTVGDAAGAVLASVPFYVAFVVVMLCIGLVIARWARLDVPAGRAVMFSGVTRNSLVVLPLALALPAGFEAAAVVVVTQTLVEVLGMVACVRVVPRLLPMPV